MRGPIPETVWSAIEAEFTLPSEDNVRGRIENIGADAEPTMRNLVRVFIDDRTCCPGFQFQADGSLHPAVIALFQKAMELRIPHNYFSAWMVTASTDLAGSRPVDRLNDLDNLLGALEVFAHR